MKMLPYQMQAVVFVLMALIFNARCKQGVKVTEEQFDQINFCQEDGEGTNYVDKECKKVNLNFKGSCVKAYVHLYQLGFVLPVSKWIGMCSSNEEYIFCITFPVTAGLKLEHHIWSVTNPNISTSIYCDPSIDESVEQSFYDSSESKADGKAKETAFGELTISGEGSGKGEDAV